MRHPAVPDRASGNAPSLVIDLDALVADGSVPRDVQLVRWTPPAVVDGELVTHPAHLSPLDADAAGRYPTVLRGGVVTNVDEVRRIRARVDYALLPPWRRAITSTPGGWR